MAEKVINNIFKIDDIDKTIIQMIQEEPELSHEKIAKKVRRSQPTVGSRIKKLKEAGVFKFQAGINLKTTNLLLARAEIETKNQQAIEELVRKCPFMINAFRLSGNSNISVLLASFDLNHLDRIINFHFRKNPEVKSVIMEIITNVANDYVVPFNLNFEECEWYLGRDCFINHMD